MKKSFEVNLGGRIFNFDEDAYELLNNYMESLKECFSKQDGGEEIIADIEVRLGELCETRMREGAARIVNFTMVDEFITRMGRPESLAQEAVGTQDTAEDGAAPEDNAQQKREPWRDAMLLGKKLFRDTRNGLLGGVFSGLAAYTGINAWLLRVVAILLFFWLAGIVIPIVYIVAWIILPMALSVTDLLRMRDIKPAPGERVEDAWAREYERASAELLSSGAARDNKGCLVGCVVAIAALIILPIIFFFLFFASVAVPFTTAIGSLNPLFGLMGDTMNFNINILLSTILLPFIILIPIFLIIHYLMKRKGSVRPLKMWLKVLLVALWVILLGIFLSLKEKSVDLPFLKYEKRIISLKDASTSLSDIERFVDEVKKIASSPEVSELKNYFFHDNYSSSKRCTRMLWHCITSASNDSIVPFAAECTQLDDKIIWKLMPRDEWVELIKTPASVSNVEIVGSFSCGVEEFSSAEIVCVIDTTAKRMFVDLSRCNGPSDLRINVNSIPGWTVDYTQGAAVQPEHPDRVELILKAYSNEEFLPKIVVRTLAPDSVNVDTKDMRHTLYRQRISK
ncbi:MAG: PspC domain-containing protein [Bacteroidaceae bacterium]|nr:PspC domain-containing protein [Bacteroidaceae bacterium]